MKNARKWISAVLYIILSVFALLIWMYFIIGASFGPAPPPPGFEYESTTSWGDLNGILVLGLLGAALGIVGGIKGLTKKPAGKGLLIIVAALVTIGSVPSFLMDIGEFGVLAFLTGVLPTLIYIIVRGKRKVEVKDISDEGQ